MQKVRLRFQKGDWIAIAAVLVLAVVVFSLFLPQSRASSAGAEIYLDGELVRTLSLKEDRTFTLTGDYTNTITVADGKIAVTQSDCPGADCVACGWTNSAARSIVCLPNTMEIRVVAPNGDDVDFVVR